MKPDKSLHEFFRRRREVRHLTPATIAVSLRGSKCGGIAARQRQRKS